MFAVMGEHDMVGEPAGTHHLTDEFHTRLSSEPRERIGATADR